MKASKKVLSVIIPAYNEATSIQTTLKKVLDQQSVGQVIVIDDGSTDNTFENARLIVDNRLQLIQHSVNSGKGAAISSAIPLLKFPISLIQDED